MASNGTLLKAKEVAQRLGVSEQWVRVRCCQKEIPHIKLGHLVRFLPEQIEEYITRRRRGEEDKESQV
ncbi:MAG: helix-turn-helix domain-containing protein [Candidatus Hodarchaeota archaeon]